MDSLSKLKTSYIDELNKSNTAYAKKKAFRSFEIHLACMLTVAHGYYFQMMMHRFMSMHGKVSYERAEDVADLLNEFFNVDTKPADLLHTTEEYTNQAIKSYKAFKGIQEILVNNQLCKDKQDLIAFCKRVEHDKKYASFHMFSSITYGIYARTIIAYMLGECTHEEAMARFRGEGWPAEKDAIHLMPFVRDLYKVFELFSEIYDKRRMREKGKNPDEKKDEGVK